MGYDDSGCCPLPRRRQQHPPSRCCHCRLPVAVHVNGCHCCSCLQLQLQPLLLLAALDSAGAAAACCYACAGTAADAAAAGSLLPVAPGRALHSPAS